MKEWGLQNVALEKWPRPDACSRADGRTRSSTWPRCRRRRSRFPARRRRGRRAPRAWFAATWCSSPRRRRKICRSTPGKLKGKWILTQPAPDVAAFWTAPATRNTTEELERDGTRRRRRQPSSAYRTAAGRGGRRAVRRAADGGAGRRDAVQSQRILPRSKERVRHIVDGRARPRHLHDRRQPDDRPGDVAAGGRRFPPNSTAAWRACSRRSCRSRSRPTSRTPTTRTRRCSTSSARFPAPTRPTRS